MLTTLKNFRKWFETNKEIVANKKPKDEVIRMKTSVELWDGNDACGPHDNDVVMISVKSDGLPVFVVNNETGRMVSSKDLVIQINGGNEIVSLIAQMTKVIDTIQESNVVQCKVKGGSDDSFS